MHILIAGSSGNLGRYLSEYFNSRGHSVVVTQRMGASAPNIATFTEYSVALPSNTNPPELIINCTGLYLSDDVAGAFASMGAAILAPSVKLSKANELWGAKCINFSSFFQFAPDSPFKYESYIHMKNESCNIWKAHADKTDLGVIDFVLYDNFGGYKKNKFLDLLISSARDQVPLSASNPNARINLSHISRISHACEQILQREFSEFQQFQIKSIEEYSLDDLTRMVEVLSGRKSLVRFGEKSARFKQVDEIWNSTGDFAMAFESMTVSKYIEKQLII
jgi:nucleoside-diphosphate-sugar epimerase